MRVVRVVTRCNRGGPLRQLQALVPGLAARGIGGPVWVGEPAAGEEDASDVLRAAGAEVVRVPGLGREVAPGSDLRAWRWMRERLRRERPDLVHTHLAKAGALGRLAARAAGVRATVHTFHGHHLTAPWPGRTAARLGERRLARLTTAAVCLSPSQRADLVERFRVLPAGKAVVIGPGIDVEGFRASVYPGRVAAVRARHAAGVEALFVWVGRFVPVKDPLAAVAACAEAAADPSRPRFRLVLVGEGRLRERVARAAAAAGLGDRVVFAGPVADPETWVAASDGLLLSSRSEGTPIAAVEAACLGRPVVATAVGGVPDVVRDGETGCLVAPGAGVAGRLAGALARLAGDAALRARLGAGARADAGDRFSAERLVSETAALYARCLAETGGGAGDAGPPPGGVSRSR